MNSRHEWESLQIGPRSVTTSAVKPSRFEPASEACVRARRMLEVSKPSQTSHSHRLRARNQRASHLGNCKLNRSLHNLSLFRFTLTRLYSNFHPCMLLFDGFLPIKHSNCRDVRAAVRNKKGTVREGKLKYRSFSTALWKLALSLTMRYKTKTNRLVVHVFLRFRLFVCLLFWPWFLTSSLWLLLLL